MTIGHTLPGTYLPSWPTKKIRAATGQRHPGAEVREHRAPHHAGERDVDDRGQQREHHRRGVEAAQRGA
jgi:hypothetical protein